MAFLVLMTTMLMTVIVRLILMVLTMMTMIMMTTKTSLLIDDTFYPVTAPFQGNMDRICSNR